MEGSEAKSTNEPFSMTSNWNRYFPFAIDIDGVLIRSTEKLPYVTETLQRLQIISIPFIFLTNSGGVHESKLVEKCWSFEV